MKKIKYLLFFFIILLSSNVYASEFNMNNYTSATLGGTKNRYRGTEIDNTGTANTYQFNTRYNGRISMLETYFDYPFVANTTYTLTYNMATEDFRNNFSAYYWWDCSEEMNATNQHVGSFSYVSYKKVKFTFKPTENTTCIRVMLGSSNPSITAITGISNWNLSSITIYDPDWQTGSGSGQGSTVAPTPTPNSNQDIINNQNNNTEDIINNNNENTQNIIENNNENTQNIIDSNLVCKSYSLNDSGTLFDGYLGGTGIFYQQSGNYNKTTDFIPIPEDTRVFLKKSSSTNKRLCFYNAFRENTGCYTTNEFDNGHEFSIPNNSIFFRINFEVSENSPIIDFCSNGNQAINDSINKVNDSINNSNVDNGTGSDFFNNFDDQDFGLSSIITIPLNTIQGLTSKSCVALNVPIPFTNSSVPLPCMTQVYEQNIPTIYNLWKIVSFGIIAYFIAIDIFHMVKGFKDPESDKVEVLDL